MKDQTQGLSLHGGAAEETLRLIAGLPAPAGLEERVQEKLRTAPRRARVLAWPAGSAAGNWVRGAAAAAIVCVVAGGGWSIYTRVQPGLAAREQVLPAQTGSGGGFASAGAMRTPDTLKAPAAPAQTAPIAGKKTVQPAKTKDAVRRTAKAAGGAGAPE